MMYLMIDEMTTIRFHKYDSGMKFKDLPRHLQEMIKIRLSELENINKE